MAARRTWIRRSGLVTLTERRRLSDTHECAARAVRMGREAVRLLHQKLRNPSELCGSVGMDFQWLDLGTSGPPPR